MYYSVYNYPFPLFCNVYYIGHCRISWRKRGGGAGVVDSNQQYTWCISCYTALCIRAIPHECNLRIYQQDCSRYRIVQLYLKVSTAGGASLILKRIHGVHTKTSPSRANLRTINHLTYHRSLLVEVGWVEGPVQVG